MRILISIAKIEKELKKFKSIRESLLKGLYLKRICVWKIENWKVFL